jgi:hypothetical protein
MGLGGRKNAALLRNKTAGDKHRHWSRVQPYYFLHNQSLAELPGNDIPKGLNHSSGPNLRLSAPHCEPSEPETCFPNQTSVSTWHQSLQIKHRITIFGTTSMASRIRSNLIR